MTESNKDRLKTATPALRDLVVRTANSYNRNFPTDVNTVDMGVFSEEAEKLRALALTSGKYANFLAVVEHATGKLLLTPFKTAQNTELEIGLEIKIKTYGMTRQRKERQDRSVGLVVSTAKNDFDTLPVVASLLIEEREPLSPAGVMIVDEQGTHLFFRSQSTIQQTIAQNRELVEKVKGSSIKEFAKWNQLRHFYCPKGATTATPVLM